MVVFSQPITSGQDPAKIGEATDQGDCPCHCRATGEQRRDGPEHGRAMRCRSRPARRRTAPRRSWRKGPCRSIPRRTPASARRGQPLVLDAIGEVAPGEHGGDADDRGDSDDPADGEVRLIPEPLTMSGRNSPWNKRSCRRRSRCSTSSTRGSVRPRNTLSWLCTASTEARSRSRVDCSHARPSCAARWHSPVDPSADA